MWLLLCRGPAADVRGAVHEVGSRRDRHSDDVNRLPIDQGDVTQVESDVPRCRSLEQHHEVRKFIASHFTAQREHDTTRARRATYFQGHRWLYGRQRNGRTGAKRPSQEDLRLEMMTSFQKLPNTRQRVRAIRLAGTKPQFVDPQRFDA